MGHRQRLRELLESDDILVTPGVYDGISARVIEEVGFDAAFISGAGVSNSLLGIPDMGFLNLTDNVTATESIVQAVDIPVLTDADTGYGNAVNVNQTVKRLERTGVTSIMIEDQKFPKRCGHMAGKDVISHEEMCGKIASAVDARNETDPDLCILARTDTAHTHDVDEAIRRLNDYADLGADIVFADALLSKDDISRLAKNVDAHSMVNMGYGIRKRPTTPLMSTSELEDLGVSMVGYPRLITGAAARGMHNALETLKESEESGEIIERPEQTMGWDEYMELMDHPEFTALEDKYAEITGPAHAETD